jgi:hypothetical protein
METKQLIGRRFASTPVSRITLPGFQIVTGTLAPVATATQARSAATSRKLSIAAAIVAPQGHAISVALRTVVARIALVKRAA